MIKAFLNYISEVRQRRADLKAASVDGSRLDFAKMIDDAQNERIALRENPPPCGSMIRYDPITFYEDAYGEFLFKAADVEQEVEDSIRECTSDLASDDEGAVLIWTQGRDETLTEPTDVPSIWDRFKYVANDLVRAGKAEIYCKKCQATIGSDQVTTNDDSGKRGWNFDRIVCPHGHNLLVVERVHLMMR